MPAEGLVGPVLSRVISVFAVRADFSVDRLSDAVLLGDAVAAQASSHFAEGRANLVVDADDGAVKIRVGPLVPGAGDQLLDADAHPARSMPRSSGSPTPSASSATATRSTC